MGLATVAAQMQGDMSSMTQDDTHAAALLGPPANVHFQQELRSYLLSIERKLDQISLKVGAGLDATDGQSEKSKRSDVAAPKAQGEERRKSLEQLAVEAAEATRLPGELPRRRAEGPQQAPRQPGGRRSLRRSGQQQADAGFARSSTTCFGDLEVESMTGSGPDAKEDVLEEVKALYYQRGGEGAPTQAGSKASDGVRRLSAQQDTRSDGNSTRRVSCETGQSIPMPGDAPKQVQFGSTAEDDDFVEVLPTDNRRGSQPSASSIITEDNLRLGRLQSYVRIHKDFYAGRRSMLNRVTVDRVADTVKEVVNKRTTERKKRSIWRFVHGAGFEFVSSSMIALNVIMIGVIADARLNASLENTKESPAWEYIEVTFFVYFLVEVMLRIASDRILFILGPEWRWNMFDFMLVLFSTVDFFFSKVTTLAITDITVARILRFVRFIRVIRVARAVRAFHSLRIVVFAIIESMVSLMWCLLVVGLIIYMFALAFLLGVTEHVQSPEWGSSPDKALILEYFGNVPRALLALFMTISGGVDWEDTMRPLRSIHWIYQPMFTAYVFLMVIGVLNVVMGSFVAATAEITNRDRENCVKHELQQFQAYTSKIKTFFEEADKDGSGMLSWTEFQEHLEVPNVAAYFRALELDMSQAHVLFRLLDRDGSGEVSLDEFLAGCLRLKGQAKSLEVNMLLYENKRLFNKISDFMEAIMDNYQNPSFARKNRRASTTR